MPTGDPPWGWNIYPQWPWPTHPQPYQPTWAPPAPDLDALRRAAQALRDAADALEAAAGGVGPFVVTTTETLPDTEDE